jgi:hypothetical protein
MEDAHQCRRWAQKKLKRSGLLSPIGFGLELESIHLAENDNE